ncbi:MAG: MFS transporter [Alphaproteobacteria bacterium]
MGARPYFGWYVVGCAFLLALFGWGLGFYGAAVYLHYLQERHGWPASAIAGAVTAYYFFGALLLAGIGGLFDRFGPRPVVAVAVVAMSSGVALLPAVSTVWQLYPVFLLMAVGWAGMSMAAVNTIVAPWFEHRRGLAISLALNGASLGGVLVAPPMILLVERFGFSAGLWMTATAALVVLLPAIGFVLGRDPAEAGPARDGMRGRGAGRPGTATSPTPEDPAGPWRIRTVLRRPNFWTLTLPFAFGLTAQVGFLTHQVAYLSPLLGPAQAALCVSLVTIAAVVGRVGTGFFVDRIDRRAGASANFLLQCVGVLVLLAADDARMLYAGCVLFGLGVGNQITFPGLIVQQEFPRAHFSRVIALVAAVNQFTFASGPAFLGLLRDRTGDYRAALLACFGLLLAASIIVLVRRRG